MRSLAALAVIGSLLTGLVPTAASAQPSASAPSTEPRSGAPLADALRVYVRESYPKLILAAEAMPAAKYDFRVTPAERSFGETVFHLGDYGRAICGRIANVPAPWPRRPMLTPESPKDSLVERLRDDARFCEAAFVRLDDAALADSVWFDVREDPVGALPVPRAAAILGAAAYWTDVYARLSESLRLNGIVPPKPSGAGISDPNPGSGRMLCENVRAPREGERWGGPGYSFTLSDGVPETRYTVMSDGSGPYVSGTSNVLVVAASRAGVMVLGGPSKNGAARRAIRVDLREPVPGGGGTPLGVVIDSSHLEVAAQWKADWDGPRRRRASLLADIPVGATVEAAQLDVQFHIDGLVHALQAGPQPIGHCFSDQPAIHGRGTNRGTIHRVDSTTWVVDLPPGSVGRLYDVSLGYPHAVDRGLYRVALRFTVRGR